MTFVSVIIPTYNRGHVLKRAITSVLNQTWPYFELIVVDDGSTDNTQDILDSLYDPRLKKIYQENKGVSASRNLGIAASSGQFIALLDSDDHWLPQKLAAQVQFMTQGPWEISQTNEIWIRHGVRVNPPKKYSKPSGWFLEKSLQLCLISPSCVMLTRQLWQELGPFDPTLLACEDYSLWLRVGLRYPVGLLPQALTIKTGGHSDQLSRSIMGLDLYRIYAMIHVLQSISLSFEQQQLIIQALQDRVYFYIKGCLKHGNDLEALRIKKLYAELLFNLS